MLVILLAFLIGIIAGLRAFTAPALVSWAARVGWIPVDGTALAFVGSRWTPWILSFAALGEIVSDKLPGTQSRKVPQQFIARLVTGALSGCAIAFTHNETAAGIIAGVLGALVGTLGGAELRERAVKAIGGKDLPIALLEDVLAVLGALAIVKQMS